MSGETWRYVLTVEGREIELSDGEATLGRSRTSTVRVEHESVSRSHALLTLHKGEVMVRDLNSSNGTWVAGRRLSSEARLQNGARVQLGAAVVELRIVPPGIPSERTALLDPGELPPSGAAPPTAPGPPPASPLPAPTTRDEAPAPGGADLATQSGLEAKPMTASGLFGEIDRQALAPQAEPSLVVDVVSPAPPPPPLPPAPPPAEAVTLPPPHVPSGVADVSLPLAGVQPPARGAPVSDHAGMIDRRAAPGASRTSANPPASLGARFLAFLVDSALVSLMNVVLFSPVGVILYFRPSLQGGAPGSDPVLGGIVLLSTVLVFVANVLYFAGLWAIRGRTPGYALLHLAVVRRGVSPGQGIGFKAAILRFLFFVLGALPLYAGWWMAFFSAERLAWHDRVAGTRVVRTD